MFLFLSFMPGIMWGMALKLLAFLTSALDEEKDKLHALTAFPRGESLWKVVRILEARSCRNCRQQLSKTKVTKSANVMRTKNLKTGTHPRPETSCRPILNMSQTVDKVQHIAERRTCLHLSDALFKLLCRQRLHYKLNLG